MFLLLHTTIGLVSKEGRVEEWTFWGFLASRNCLSSVVSTMPPEGGGGGGTTSSYSVSFTK